MAERMRRCAALGLALVVVGAMFLHQARRSDLLDDVVAVPLGPTSVVALSGTATTLALPRTSVRRPGDVALRMSTIVVGGVPTTVALRVLARDGSVLASCSYRAGTIVDAMVLRCRVPDLSAVRKVRFSLEPATPSLGVVAAGDAAGQLLSPRSGTLAGRLRTIYLRLGAKHPAPFWAWVVPVGAVLWVALVAYVGFALAGSVFAGIPPERDSPNGG